MKVTIFLYLAALIFLGSCSIEKRLYNKGWHIDWHRKYRSEQEKTRPGELSSPEMATQPIIRESTIPDSLPATMENGIENTVISPKNSDYSEPKPYKSLSQAPSEPIALNRVTEKTAQPVKSSKWDEEEKKRSTTILAVLLVLAILGMVAIFLGLQTTLTVPEIIALFLLLVLLGIIALLLLVVLLAMLATRSDEVKDKRKKQDDSS
jgi:hypothetical protein